MGGKTYRGTSWRFWFKGHINGYRPYENINEKYIITWSSLKHQWEVWSYAGDDLGTIAAGGTWKAAVDNWLKQKNRKQN